MKKIWLLLALSTLILSGCELGARVQPEPTPTEAALPSPVPAEPTATPEPPPTESPTTAPAPEPSATVPPTGAIIGLVFHDVCANLETGGAGCVDGAADGQFTEQDEPLAGVRVFLGAGACPAFGLAETTTNDQGFYAFAELASGIYCVTVDPTANAGLEPAMLPGRFSVPRGGQATLGLQEGQHIGDVNFGWDYDLLPSSAKDCIDRLEVVEVPRTPDGWSMGAGVEFTRVWRLKNAGECTWGPDYALVHADGEAMTETTSILLGRSVAPGEEVDLALALTSPAEPGEHSGVWLLRNERGFTFGAGEQSNIALTLSIRVIPELLTSAALGAPTLRDTLDADDRWNLFEDKHAAMTLEGGHITLTSKETIGFDSWTVTAGTLGDATIEAIFTTGPACSGYDRYGLIVRSETINTGYFLGISCNGYFSIRQWNGRKWEMLAPWTLGVGINTGPDQTNHVVVVMSGNTLSLFVNGQLQATVTDKAKPIYGGGRFGPFIAAQDTKNFTVYLEEIAYWSTP